MARAGGGSLIVLIVLVVTFLLASRTVATSQPVVASPPAPAGSAAPAEAGRSLRAACEFLWGRQGQDGGWHSETYGLLRSGQALTPFVLRALLSAPADSCPAAAGGVERARGFVRRHVSADGIVGADDPDVLEYPNYSTAYAVRCLARAGAPDDRGLVDRGLIDRMSRRLVAEQFTEARGFTTASPAFGGWGFGGRHRPGHTGHMDIAHTRRVLQALREAGVDDPQIYERARLFLRFMQRHPAESRPHPTPSNLEAHQALGTRETRDTLPRAPRFDGGFFLSPVVLDANKGAVFVDESGPYHGSYATATADGLLALLAAGVPADDERVRAARAWLERHEGLDHPAGIPRGGPQAWGAAVYFYHLAVRAEAEAALGFPRRLAAAIARELRPHQRPDGSFINERNHLMKENDPLLATALAVVALS